MHIQNGFTSALKQGYLFRGVMYCSSLTRSWSWEVEMLGFQQEEFQFNSQLRAEHTDF